MKSLILLCIFIFNTAIANTASLKVDPQVPIKGEDFTLTFEIQTQERTEPFIAFDPGEIAVISKGESGYSTRTTIINGKISTERKLSISYVLNAPKAGIKRIKDISIDVGGQKIKLRDFKIKIGSESFKNRDLFLLAETSKTSVFLGEGLTVNYYLYHRSAITTVDFDKFPKLNNFVKRFHNPPATRERVSYNGQVYERRLTYTARLYPTKVGELRVDPLKLKVGVVSGGGNSPFGVFGLRGGRQRLKSLSSQNLNIDVKPLPSANMPENFTGLVGKHEFSFSQPRSKFLVNEAIELKLTVNGPGLLEKYDGPQIYSSPNLEEFDIKSEIKEEGLDRARKIFDYTYLARSNLEIDGRVLKLYYLNPESGSYEFQEIKIPKLVASGGSSNGVQSEPGTKSVDSKAIGLTEEVTRQNIVTSELPPLFNVDEKGSVLAKYLNYLLSFFIFAILLELFFRFYQETRPGFDRKTKFYNELKKGKVSYKNIYSFLTESLPGGGGLKDRVLQSDVSKESKDYFLHLLNSYGKSEYKDKKKLSFKVEAKHLNEFFEMKKKENESSNRYF